MTPAQLKRLEREWAAKLRADGFQDIESPSGMVPQPLSHGVSAKITRHVAELEQDREATPRLTFEEPWEVKAWALHCEDVSNREIARRLCVYRKLVDQTFARLRKQVRAKGRGRKRDPDSLRSHEVLLTVRLGPAHAVALDHVRTVLKCNGPEALRAAVVEFANRISRKGATLPWGVKAA